MKKTRPSYLLLTLCLSLVYSTISFAAPKLYQVEIIVFSTLNSNALNQEIWPLIYPSSLNNPHTIALNYNSTTTPAGAFQVLPPSDWTLNREENALRANPNYHVVLHMAWLQPNRKTTVHIFGGNGFDENGNVIATDPSANVPADTRWEVNALFTMSVIQYVDSHSTFLFSTPAGSVASLSKNHLNNIANGLATFRITDDRRMKIGELNYLDGPVFGVLLKVSPR